MNDHTEETGFGALLRIIRRRWLIVLIPVVLVPCIAAAYALSREDEYSATTALLVRSAPGSGVPLSSADDEEREAATNVSLASLGRIAERTARALGDGLTAATVSSSIETSGDGSANVLFIKATNHEQDLVAPMANEFARQFAAFRRQADLRTVRSAQRRTLSRLDEVQNELTALNNEAAPTSGTPESGQRLNRIRTLRRERDQLLDASQEVGTLATLTTGNIEVTQRASAPSEPSSSGPASTIGLGLALGLLMGLGLALLFEALDRRLRDPKDIESAFNRPTLGAIPLSAALDRNGRKKLSVRGKTRALGAGEMEAFHMLRANLRYFEADRRIRSVVVTSAAPGEGKSTVSWNLAAASANAGNRVLLIEAELRRPTFVREFKLDAGPGLSEILTNEVEAQDVVRRLSTGPRGESNGNGQDSGMDVIVAGRIPPNPTDLLESARMEQLIRAAEQEYDLVVIDTPPVSIVSDAIPVLKRADGVIVVSLLGSTSRDSAEHLRKQLDKLGANFLGVVINGISSADGYYGSVYGYAERYEAAGQPAAR